MLSRSNALLAGIFSLWAMSGVAIGQSLQTLPPANDSTAGGTSNYIPLGANTGGRHLTLFGADQLTGIPVGSVITGLQLRLRNAATTGWPNPAANLSDYEIWLSQSTRTPATISATYADNILNPVRVRDGALSLALNTYPGGGATGSTPEGWGPVITLQTAYVYKGGVLGVEFRTTGGGAPTNQFADCTLNSAGAAGLGAAPNPNDPTGTPNSAVIVRLTFTPPVTDLARGVTKVIVPDVYVNTGSSTLSTLIADSARTAVSVASANQFDTIGPGSDFIGLSWRLAPFETTQWPMAAANFTKYDVELSRSQNLPGSLSSTVANNVGADAVMVRSGPMTIPINSFRPVGSQPSAAFRYDVDFSAPYHYRNGPLLQVVRHDGQSAGTAPFLDAVASNDPAGAGVVQGMRGAPSNSLTTPTLSSYTITRFKVDAGTSSPLNQLTPGSGRVGALTAQLQTILSASELKYVPVGSVIDSLWLRVNSGAASAPATDMFATDLEVSLSSATNQPASMSTTFANNEGADKVLVRDGGFSLGAGALPAGSDGHFGKLVQFQKHFVYKGGPLCVTIRHTGLTGGNIDEIEGLFGTATTNRSVFSLTSGPATGSFFGGSFTGTAMKLGYIPSVMTPNALATSEGSDGANFPNEAAYTGQAIIAADQLRAIEVGSAITGMSFRQSGTGGSLTFPATSTTMPRFDVTISPAAHGPLSASSTFANNNSANVWTVRTGPMTVPANAFPYSGSITVPGENVWYVEFDHAYVYTGGDLCITMRGEGELADAQFWDTDGFVPTAQGALLIALGNSNALVTTRANYGPMAIRLAFTPRAFCPWDLNNDGLVEDSDFTIFLNAYNILDCADGTMPQGCPADFNYDRVVDDLDFTAFLGPYNTLVCP